MTRDGADFDLTRPPEDPLPPETPEAPVEFQHTPFHVTPDTSMIFPHRRFEEALAALKFGVETGKGFIVITGDVGSGKTTLLRHFANSLPKGTRSAAILNSGLNADELLEAIADDLGLLKDAPSAGARPRKKLIDLLNHFLFAEFEAGRTVIVFIDEAQNLSIEALEVIRMLSNLETETEKLLQIVLFGQPELQEMLARPELRQLRSRIAVTYHLTAMDPEETMGYIEHRLNISLPSAPVLFTKAAIRLVHRYARGIPRIINIVCDQALAAAQAYGLRTVEKDIVESVVAGFDHLDNPRRSRRILATAMISALAAGIVTLGYLSTRPSTVPAAARPAPQTRVATPAPKPISSEPAAPPEALTPVRRVLTSYGLTPPAETERMTLEEIADATGLRHIRVLLPPATIARLGVPAILGPLDPPFYQNRPALVLDMTSHQWHCIAPDGTDVTVPAPAIELLNFHFLLPPRPYMDRFIRRSTVGQDVLVIQKILARAGLLGSYRPGRYDATTIAAVQKLQADYGINEDGVVGPKTSVVFSALERRLERDRQQ